MGQRHDFARHPCSATAGFWRLRCTGLDAAIPMSGWRGRDRVSAFARGRICTAAGCGTILSVYNPLSCCVIHDRREASLQPRTSCKDRPSTARVCANPACGHMFESPNPKRQYCSDSCRMQAFHERRRPAEDAVQ